MSSVPDAGAKVDVIRIDGLQKKKNRMTEKENPLKKKKSIFVIKKRHAIIDIVRNRRGRSGIQGTVRERNCQDSYEIPGGGPDKRPL